MLISQLPEEYRELAKQRRREYQAKEGKPFDEDDDEIARCFLFEDTPEGQAFWFSLHMEHLPEKIEDDGIFK